MRIAVVVDSYFPVVSGAAVFQKRLTAALHKRGHSVLMIAPSERHTFYHTDVDGFPGVRIPSLGVPFGYKLRLVPNPWKCLERVLGEFEPDVLSLEHPFTMCHAAQKYARIHDLPVMATNHTIPESLIFPVRWLGPLHQVGVNLLWSSLISFLDGCDSVTTPTRTSADMLLDHGIGRSVEVISCGIDLATFSPDVSGLELRRSLNLPDKPTVLYAGRLDGEKQMYVWIDAIPKVLERVDAHFVVGGEGGEKQRLQAQARDLGVADHVSFIGFVAEGDLPQLYRLADVFAIAAPVELQSIVTLEAAACGLPIVAAGAAALPELVQEGKNGHLFAAGDSQALADCICEILEDPARGKTMGQFSRSLARKHSFERTVDEYEGVLRRLCNARPRTQQLRGSDRPGTHNPGPA